METTLQKCVKNTYKLFFKFLGHHLVYSFMRCFALKHHFIVILPNKCIFISNPIFFMLKNKTQNNYFITFIFLGSLSSVNLKHCWMMFNISQTSQISMLTSLSFLGRIKKEQRTWRKTFLWNISKKLTKNTWGEIIKNVYSRWTILYSSVIPQK